MLCCGGVWGWGWGCSHQSADGFFVVVVVAESVSWRNIISRPLKTRSGGGLPNLALLPPPPPPSQPRNYHAVF